MEPVPRYGYVAAIRDNWEACARVDPGNEPLRGGLKARKYINAGDFVPDNVTLLGRAKETARSDDNEAIIRRRLNLQHEQIEAVVDQYARRRLVT